MSSATGGRPPIGASGCPALDKRSVIPLEAGDFDQWLEGTVDQARALMRLVPVEIF